MQIVLRPYDLVLRVKCYSYLLAEGNQIIYECRNMRRLVGAHYDTTNLFYANII